MKSIYMEKFPKVDRIFNPTKQEFNEKYGFGSMPVLIEGMMDTWKAKTSWTFDFFQQVLGNSEEYAERSASHVDYRLFKVSEYIQYMRDCPDKDPYYLKNCRFHRDTELLDDYVVPDYFKSWHMILPKEERPPLSWLYIGATNTFSPLHLDVWDTSAWNAVISGTKLWMFYPAAQSPFLYDGAVNPFEPNYEKYPHFAQATPLVCIQKPGEVVFTPSGWWHAVYNVEGGISITENFINETNYTKVKDYFKKKRLFEKVIVIDQLTDECLAPANISQNSERYQIQIP